MYSIFFYFTLVYVLITKIIESGISLEFVQSIQNRLTRSGIWIPHPHPCRIDTGPAPKVKSPSDLDDCKRKNISSDFISMRNDLLTVFGVLCFGNMRLSILREF